MLDRETLDILDHQSQRTLGLWWKILNGWGWPTELPEPVDEHDADNPRRADVMTYIESEIGFKECLRAWNSKRMDDKQFEEWWSTRPNVQQQRNADSVLNASILDA